MGEGAREEVLAGVAPGAIPLEALLEAESPLRGVLGTGGIEDDPSEGAAEGSVGGTAAVVDARRSSTTEEAEEVVPGTRAQGGLLTSLSPRSFAAAERVAFKEGTDNPS